MAPFNCVVRRVLIPLAAGAFLLQTTTTCNSTAAQATILTGLESFATVLVDSAFLIVKNNQETGTPAQFGAGNGQTSGTGGATTGT
jgi:hypothetical protein